jgi:CubicO group peptidase (beta-lactamase class C family)
MSFAAFTEKYIFQPLQMNSSAWFLREVDMKKHAIPYLATGIPLPFYSLTTYPDGSLITSADDLSKYVIEMILALNGQSTIVSKKSADVIFSSDSLPQHFTASKRTKGIFWNLYTDGFIGHDGDDPGVSTTILFNKNCGIFFLTNIYIDNRDDF